PAEISSFKKRMGLAGKRIVLYLGRLSEAQKNVSALIKAFQEIDDESMRLLIVGDGKSRQLYEEMASKDRRIILAGRVPEDMLPLYYSIADLYVLPSIWESFNATFIEAATFGAPLLLSENAINKDIEERFGRKLMLFNPNDIEELRNKITAVLNDKALRNQLLELSKDIAKEYSKKAQMDAYANAIKKFYKDGTF
ncbi:glycosyltransferase family 4 protein, partial [Candidatus Marsarchaeota archaeon]|nr:glycosyltransferase family 4 protein [Candidatus Marsarchaeota archaeon]